MVDPNARPVLQKPPGYRDPTGAASAGPNGTARPLPPRKPAQLPPALRRPGKPIPRNRHRYRHGRSLCCRVCCCFSLLLFTLFFLLAVTAALSYLYFQPRTPLLRIQAVQVSRFNVSSHADGSGTFLDAAVSVKIFTSNPNFKIALSYGDTDARMYIADDDDDIPVGSGTIPRFEQAKRNATVLRFSAAAKGILVDDSVGARLRTRFRSKDIRFGVEMRTKVGLRVGGKAICRVPVRVECRRVSQRQLGKSGVTLPRCDVYLFRWINLH